MLTLRQRNMRDLKSLFSCECCPRLAKVIVWAEKNEKISKEEKDKQRKSGRGKRRQKCKGEKQLERI